MTRHDPDAHAPRCVGVVVVPAPDPLREDRVAGRRLSESALAALQGVAGVGVAGGIEDAEFAGAWPGFAAAEVLVLHFAHCPLVTSSFIERVVAMSMEEPGTAFVAYRPVTDTIKDVEPDGRVAGTLDRDGLAHVAAPVVLPRGVLARLSDAEPPPVGDPAALVAWLRARVPVRLVEAEPLGRRVDDDASLRLLSALADQAAVSDQVGAFDASSMA